MSNYFSSESFWQNAWRRHIDVYLANPPRCGYWLAAMFPDKKLKFIEIAGGSCRDSRYLADTGYSCIGTDFDQYTIEYLKDRFPHSSLRLFREDAFHFSFLDKSFDISFSNGFWILFSDNQQLYSLLKEQERITRRYIITLVHNATNKKLVKEFQEKAKTDQLYNIRFFQINELRTIINSSGILYKRIVFKKFGGPFDMFYSSRIKRVPNLLKKFARHIVPRLYKFQSWESTERIACVIELE